MVMTRLEKDRFQYGLAVGVIVSFLVLVVALFVTELPMGNREAALLLMGVLAGAFKDVVGYFFGSSKGSSDKTELMAGKAE